MLDAGSVTTAVHPIDIGEDGPLTDDRSLITDHCSLPLLLIAVAVAATLTRVSLRTPTFPDES